MNYDSLGTWIGTALSAFGALFALYQGNKTAKAKQHVIEIEQRVIKEVARAEEAIKSRVDEIYTADKNSEAAREIEDILKTINGYTCEKYEVKGIRHRSIITSLGRFLTKLKALKLLFVADSSFHEEACKDINAAIQILSSSSDPVIFRDQAIRLQSVISSLYAIITGNHKRSLTLGG